MHTVDRDLASTLGKSLRLADSGDQVDRSAGGVRGAGEAAGAARAGDVGAEAAVRGPQVHSDADTEPDTA